MAGEQVLIVDDEKPLVDVLVPFLERAGFSVESVLRGDVALPCIKKMRPDVVVLDVLLPGLDGREVCRRLRAGGDRTPVIMLTQVGGPHERAMSLEEGADDYLNKPFDPGELVARIRALLRRTRGAQPSLVGASRLVSGQLMIDRQCRRAWLAGSELPLSGKAFSVLEYMMIHPDQVITRERFLDVVWGGDYPVATRTVANRIAELRKHLADDPSVPRFIETIVNVGYRFLGSVEVQE